MVGVLIAAVTAALAFAICTALVMAPVLAVGFALLVLAASLPTLGNRFGMRDM